MSPGDLVQLHDGRVVVVASSAGDGRVRVLFRPNPTGGFHKWSVPRDHIARMLRSQPPEPGAEVRVPGESGTGRVIRATGDQVTVEIERRQAPADAPGYRWRARLHVPLPEIVAANAREVAPWR